MKTATRERPILFSAAMIPALREGRKTQTRRVVNFGKHGCDDLQHVEYARDGMPIWWGSPPDDSIRQSDYYDHGMPCPYGKSGDQLWVRETFGFGWNSGAGFYTAIPPTGREDKPEKVYYKADNQFDESKGKHCWRPSIYMPRWASRINLEITGVRVQRLQDISDGDIRAEGMALTDLDGRSIPRKKWRCVFSRTWDEINGKRLGCDWESNPWVWAITFKVLT